MGRNGSMPESRSINNPAFSTPACSGVLNVENEFMGYNSFLGACIRMGASPGRRTRDPRPESGQGGGEPESGGSLAIWMMNQITQISARRNRTGTRSGRPGAVCINPHGPGPDRWAQETWALSVVRVETMTRDPIDVSWSFVLDPETGQHRT